MLSTQISEVAFIFIKEIFYFNVLNPRVEFRNPEGETYTLSLFDGNIGTKGGIVNTPWSRRLTGIPKGRYSVSFVSDDFSLFDEHLGSFRVELETDYFYGGS